MIRKSLACLILGLVFTTSAPAGEAQVYWDNGLAHDQDRIIFYMLMTGDVSGAPEEMQRMYDMQSRLAKDSCVQLFFQQIALLDALTDTPAKRAFRWSLEMPLFREAWDACPRRTGLPKHETVLPHNLLQLELPEWRQAAIRALLPAETGDADTASN